MQVSGATANNFTSPIIYTVTAADGLDGELHGDNDGGAFRHEGHYGLFVREPPGDRNDENVKTIAVTVPFGM